MHSAELRHVFLINPVSGQKDAAISMPPRIQKAAAELGLQPVIETTRAPRHATELAERYAAEGGPVRLYAVGGDGTLNEVLAGAYLFPNAEVASVPCGSGNDFVRSFGQPEVFLNLPALMQGRAVEIDLMQVDGGICAAITSTGLDAEVAYNIPKYRRLPFLGGTMAYNISVLERVLHHLGKTVRITLDGKTAEGEYLIVAVCNGKTYGGGYLAAPMASLQDGLLDVILVKRIGRARIAKIIGQYKRGAHYANGQIVPELRDVMQHHRAKEVSVVPVGAEPFILNVDGECGPAPRLYAKVLPLAARFVLPQGLAFGEVVLANAGC